MFGKFKLLNEIFSNEVVDKVNKATDKIVSEICRLITLDNIDNEPISFDDYIKMMSKKIDETILKEEKENDLKFISGTCNISLEPLESDEKEDIILSNIKLYFEDTEDSFIESGVINKIPVKNFTDESQRKEIKEIRKSGSIKLSIKHPNNI